MTVSSARSATDVIVPDQLDRSHALALFDLTLDDHGLASASTIEGPIFDRTQYSRFKYGDRAIAEYYGTWIARRLESHLRELLTDGESVVVFGTPYKQIPNAARTLAIVAESYLRMQGLPTMYSRIYQHRLASGDYSRLSVEERNERNRRKKRFLDVDDVYGKHVVIIDDVRITGSIEKSIMAMLQGTGALTVSFVNLLRLDPVVAAGNPQLESELNHFAIQSLRDLESLMESDDFMLNTRAIKFILESDLHCLFAFASRLSTRVLTMLHEGVVDEGYDQMKEYANTSRLIRTLAYER